MSHHLLVMKKLAAIAMLIHISGCAVAPVTLDSSIKARLNSNAAAYVKVGNKAPAVVLQAGLGDDKSVWAAVAEDLAKDQTVFAYDRPGHGGNPASETPRDPCTIAAELRVMLRSAGLQPPYVLVGHSLGGLYQYVYARLYPADVAGLVLLDPTHPKHWESMQHDAPTAATLIKVATALAFSTTDRREFDAQASCLERQDTSRPLGVPTRLLVSGRFKPMEQGDFVNMVKRLRQDWLRLTQVPRIEVIHDSGHYIQKDSPEDVAAAVRALIARMPGGRQ